MNNMFESAGGSANLTSFDTSNVTTMQSMFLNSTLTAEVNNFNTSNVNNFNSFMLNSTNVSLDVAGFNFTSAVNVGSIFDTANYLQGDISVIYKAMANPVTGVQGGVATSGQNLGIPNGQKICSSPASVAVLTEQAYLEAAPFNFTGTGGGGQTCTDADGDGYADDIDANDSDPGVH